MRIREATAADFDGIWPIFHAVVSAGETYAFPRDAAREEGYRLWMEEPRRTFVAEADGAIVGSYYLKTNHLGPGSHVCNCGYMVAADARGRGIATAMCEHSQAIAREMGYRAMQFNFVVSTNEGAIRLWEKLGYAVVGRVPRAFAHPRQGLVDGLVMYKWLEPEGQ